MCRRATRGAAPSAIPSTDFLILVARQPARTSPWDIAVRASRATHFGRKVALQMLGRAEGRSAFDDLAFPSYLLHALARPTVPLYESWYRIRDAVGF